MDNVSKEDLRVIRTKEAIRKTFEEMICEMDYEKITIKELKTTLICSGINGLEKSNKTK